MRPKHEHVLHTISDNRLKLRFNRHHPSMDRLDVVAKWLPFGRLQAWLLKQKSAALGSKQAFAAVCLKVFFGFLSGPCCADYSTVVL
jgi:hypothetical protein